MLFQKPILLLLSLLTVLPFDHVSAQSSERAIPLTLGYYGPYVIQPGGKVGTTIPIKQWDRSTEAKVRKHELMISPELGAFTRPGNNINGVANVDFGYRFLGKKDLYVSPAIGLGYILSSELLANSVSLGSGDVAASQRELRHHFLPTLNFEIGHEAIARKVGWYLKATYGGKLFSVNGNSGFFALELGLRIRLKKGPVDDSSKSR